MIAEEILEMVVRSSIALLLATLGEIITERSGILNLGIEGMMAVGAASAFFVTFYTQNPFLGIIAAIFSSSALAFLHAIYSIKLKQNQILSGLAISMLCCGLSVVIGRDLIGFPLEKRLSSIPIPYLSDLPFIKVFFNQDPIVYFAFIAIPLLWFLLFKTRWGIIIRVVGEEPAFADLCGINVFKVRYLCTLFGGAMSGLAGAYLSLSYTPAWVEGMTMGQGWIALALVIFSAWNPLYALCVYIFGMIRAVQYYLQPLGIPVPFLMMLPYISTIFALIIYSHPKLRNTFEVPSSLAQPYEREKT